MHMKLPYTDSDHWSIKVSIAYLDSGLVPHFCLPWASEMMAHTIPPPLPQWQEESAFLATDFWGNGGKEHLFMHAIWAFTA